MARLSSCLGGQIPSRGPGAPTSGLSPSTTGHRPVPGWHRAGLRVVLWGVCRTHSPVTRKVAGPQQVNKGQGSQQSTFLRLEFQKVCTQVGHHLGQSLSTSVHASTQYF